MRLGIKILSIGIIVFVIILGAIYLFLAFVGKTIIAEELQRLTNKKVNIEYVSLTPPLNLEIKNLDIHGLAKADSIHVSVSILGLLTGNIALNEINMARPEFTYERISPTIAESSTTESTTELPSTSSSATTVKPKERQPLYLIFKRINIKDGKIDFIDHTVGKEAIKIVVKDINFNLSNLYTLPRSVITDFQLKGRIPWQQGEEEGRLEVEGWLNLFKKDMQATLKIEDIDGIYLHPYYSNWVDLEKARIEKAKLNFISDIHSANNNLSAESHLELTDIVFKPRPPEENQEKAERIATAVIDIFKTLDNGKIVLDFTIRTKMDKPNFGFGDIKMAFEDKLNHSGKNGKFGVDSIIAFPGKVLEGTVKSATDISKALINGTFSVGKEIKKAVEDTFKKENTVNSN